ncbi:hypothetical protein [Parashewanella tropica]|uniref:hypothetical protein n=1 Tax=Parashewanella tropica TaxID=2547970 RepID=UPI0010596C3B|nr:hypothetical protein [Parashewanella tropica]
MIKFKSHDTSIFALLLTITIALLVGFIGIQLIGIYSNNADELYSIGGLVFFLAGISSCITAMSYSNNHVSEAKRCWSYYSKEKLSKLRRLIGLEASLHAFICYCSVVFTVAITLSIIYITENRHLAQISLLFILCSQLLFLILIKFLLNLRNKARTDILRLHFKEIDDAEVKKEQFRDDKGRERFSNKFLNWLKGDF